MASFSSDDFPYGDPRSTSFWVLDDTITVWFNSEVTAAQLGSAAAASTPIRKIWIKFRVDWSYDDDAKNGVFEFSHIIDCSASGAGDHVLSIVDHVIPRAVRTATGFSPDPKDVLTATFCWHHKEELSSSIRRAIEDAAASGGPPVNLKVMVGATVYPDRIGDCVPFYVMRNIELKAYKEVEREFSEQAGECSICLNKIEEEEVVGKMPCRHVFHDDCILRSLKRSNLCPYCRQDAAA